MDRIDSLYLTGLNYLNEERYPTALRNLNDAVKLLENNEVENKDKVFASVKNLVGRCYYRMKQADKAVETAREYVKHYGEKVSDKDVTYASYMDNLSLYLLENHNDEEALSWNIKAVNLYRTLENVDDDLNVALIRQAEIYSTLGKKSDAIKIQLQALLRIKIMYGEHSEKYLNELPYQIKYYQDNDEQARADKLSDRLEILKEEAKGGYVPAMIDFTAESTHNSIDDIRMCSRYFLNHKLDAPQMKEAIDYIMGWSAASADVQIGFGDEEAKVMKDKTAGSIIVAYIASCCDYALDRRQKEFTLEMYRYGFIGMLNYYNNNIDVVGKNELFDSYLKLYEEGGYEKLVEKINENFPQEEQEE